MSPRHKTWLIQELSWARRKLMKSGDSAGARQLETELAELYRGGTLNRNQRVSLEEYGRLDQLLRGFGLPRLPAATIESGAIVYERRTLRREAEIDVEAHQRAERAPANKHNGAFGRSRRQILLDRDGGRCAYCETELTEANVTIDHVRPLSRGGRNWLSNTVLACTRCNREKADQLPLEFLWARAVLERPRLRRGAKAEAALRQAS